MKPETRHSKLETASPKRIRLIMADIDGCVVKGPGPYDLELLGRLQERNALAREDATLPAICYNSGRPVPFVECLSTTTGAHLPSLAECGSVMWTPAQRVPSIHPDYTRHHLESFRRLEDLVRREVLPRHPGIVLEAGKVCQLTVYPRQGFTMQDVTSTVLPLVREHMEGVFTIDETNHVLSFLPPGLDKGSGLLWFSELTGIAPDEMAGLGDSTSDWDFMRHCAMQFAPNNAVPELRERSSHPLSAGPGQCLDEMYYIVVAHNKSITGAP